jgi:hypothetical protein
VVRLNEGWVGAICVDSSALAGRVAMATSPTAAGPTAKRTDRK